MHEDRIRFPTTLKFYKSGGWRKRLISLLGLGRLVEGSAVMLGSASAESSRFHFPENRQSDAHCRNDYRKHRDQDDGVVFGIVPVVIETSHFVVVLLQLQYALSPHRFRLGATAQSGLIKARPWACRKLRLLTSNRSGTGCSSWEGAELTPSTSIGFRSRRTRCCPGGWPSSNDLRSRTFCSGIARRCRSVGAGITITNGCNWYRCSAD